MTPTRTTLRLGYSGSMYLLFMAGVLIAGLYTQNNLLFWTFGMMVGGILVAVMFSWWSLAGVEVRRLPPEPLIAGRDGAIRYEVSAPRAWLPQFALVVSEGWSGYRERRPGRIGGPVPESLGVRPTCWLLHLGPGQTAQLEAKFKPRQRGEVALQSVIVRSTFPFGVFSRTAVFDQPATLIVYPLLVRLDRRLVAQVAGEGLAGEYGGRHRGGADEFYGLREYRQGDSLKSVDWKRSAARGMTLSREMEQYAPPRMHVVLDLRPALGAPPKGKSKAAAARKTDMRTLGRPVLAVPDDACERAISLAASLACEGHLRGLGVGLSVLGLADPAVVPRHSALHRSAMLGVLARLPVPPPGSAAALMAGHDDRPGDTSASVIRVVADAAENRPAGGETAKPGNAILDNGSLDRKQPGQSGRAFARQVLLASRYEEYAVGEFAALGTEEGVAGADVPAAAAIAARR